MYISCPHHLGYFSSSQPVLKGGIFVPHESRNRVLFTESGYPFLTGDVENDNQFFAKQDKKETKVPFSKQEENEKNWKNREKMRQKIKNVQPGSRIREVNRF